MINDDELSRVEDLFLEVADLPPAEIDSYLDEACTSDSPSVRKEVELRLQGRNAADATATFLQTSPPLAPSDFFDPLIGQIIGGYQILKKLGGGGFGSVYLAETVDTIAQTVALKCLHERNASDDRHRSLFAQEGKILNQLGQGNDNIARLYASGVHDGRLYLVLEHIDGAPINKYCDDHRLTLDQRLELFEQLCGAVAYAHRQDVWHRDLKPHNVLVIESDQIGKVKLLDFGIAEIGSPWLSREARRAQEGAGMTLQYASPEQVLGKNSRHAADLYSLGVMLYQLLTGHLPYDLSGLDVETAKNVIATAEPPVPSTVVSVRTTDAREEGAVCSFAERCSTTPDRLARRLRAGLDDVILRALAKTPVDRFKSVAHFQDELRTAAGQPARRKKRLLVIGSMLCLTAAVGLVGADRIAKNSAETTTAAAGQWIDQIVSASTSDSQADLEQFKKLRGRLPATQLGAFTSAIDGIVETSTHCDVDNGKQRADLAASFAFHQMFEPASRLLCTQPGDVEPLSQFAARCKLRAELPNDRIAEWLDWEFEKIGALRRQPNTAAEEVIRHELVAYALILALGEYKNESGQIRLPDRYGQDALCEIYRSDPSPAIHSATRFLLLRSGSADRVDTLDVELGQPQTFIDRIKDDAWRWCTLQVTKSGPSRTFVKLQSETNRRVVAICTHEEVKRDGTAVDGNEAADVLLLCQELTANMPKLVLLQLPGRQFLFRLPSKGEWGLSWGNQCGDDPAQRTPFTCGSDGALTSRYSKFLQPGSDRDHRVNNGHEYVSGTLRPNALGVFDLNGGVAEWCSDTGADDPKHVALGGATNYPAAKCRWGEFLEGRSDSANIGARLALEITRP